MKEQEREYRDWTKFPETAEEAAVRCVRDVQKMGYYESGSTTEGVIINVCAIERRQQKDRRAGSWGAPWRMRRIQQRRKLCHPSAFSDREIQTLKALSLSIASIVSNGSNVGNG